MLARIGIKVALSAQPKAQFFAKILGPKFDTDFFLLGWTPATYDAHNPIYTLIASRGNGRGEVNVEGYNNPTMDALVDRIGVETDQAKRNGMIDEATKILQHDLPVIPLHQQVIVWATKQNVELVQLADDAFPYRYVKVK